MAKATSKRVATKEQPTSAAAHNGPTAPTLSPCGLAGVSLIGGRCFWPYAPACVDNRAARDY